MGMDSQSLLQEISGYCRRVGMAESTFGRLAVNDGKLVSRLRFGGRVTVETVERVRGFMTRHKGGETASRQAKPNAPNAAPAGAPKAAPAPSDKNFRFYDNRQKYLLFVNTCSEKWVVAERIGLEIASLHPRPPGVRVFDAGVGDGTVLSRVMRSLHNRFPTTPLYIVGKEISLEDVRLTLEKMPDRFYEHPATVFIITNMNYAEAPWLMPKSVDAATSMLWHEVSLTGRTSHEFEEQITQLQPFLSQHWRTKVSKTSGNPIYEKPVVLVLYRDDYKLLLDQMRPKRGATRADYDLVMASQPYRARASLEFKAQRVIAPLARALGPGGRLIGIHSHGQDPGLEIIQKVWPGENPFMHDRHQLLRAVKADLGSAGRDLNFNAYADARSLFRYNMHTLPSEVGESIGTSTLFAAWNAAIYVAQIEDQRLEPVIANNGYLEATREVLQKHGGLWFTDESFVISRKRDSS
jgi:SAM-dependent methyltransferase